MFEHLDSERENTFTLIELLGPTVRCHGLSLEYVRYSFSLRTKYSDIFVFVNWVHNSLFTIEH